MELLEMLGEITDRQARRSPMGDIQIPGVVLGIVTENYHKDMPGRVCVRIPVHDEDANILKWVKVARPYSGKEGTCFFHPEKDDQVLVAFEHGNIELPYVIASLPRDGDAVVGAASDEQNQVKEIVVKNGSRILFTDHKDGGEKDNIQIKTAGDLCQMVFDNEKKSILISDKDKNCVLEMKLDKGEMHVTASKKLTVKVGDSIKINLNGSNGTISVEADKISLKASRSLELSTDGTAKLSGQQTSVSASSMLKASSDGMVSIAGSPIKLG